MARPRLSVVIPTRDRPDRLQETLEAIASQAFPGLEVVVVDDGSKPGTLETLQKSPPIQVRHWLRQKGRGPAAARNRGVAAAEGERVLFLGDDTRPAPGALEQHLSDDEQGLQGHIDWDPQQPVTEVMDFLAPAGPQFYFKGLEAGESIPFTAVLGSNYSAPRRWFLQEPFDEDFPHAALEDTELAWRFRQHDWPSVYAPEALCWHHHTYEAIAPFLARQRRAGASARHALGKHPRLLYPLVLQPLVFGLLVGLRGLFRRLGGKGQRRDSWDLASRAAFLRGFLLGA